MPIGFRSWRDTGITWSVVDGVDLAKLQRRAGHDDINTTLGYAKEAEDRSRLRGRVFPALPLELVMGRESPSETPTGGAGPSDSTVLEVPKVGLEPTHLLDGGF